MSAELGDCAPGERAPAEGGLSRLLRRPEDALEFAMGLELDDASPGEHTRALAEELGECAPAEELRRFRATLAQLLAEHETLYYEKQRCSSSNAQLQEEIRILKQVQAAGPQSAELEMLEDSRSLKLGARPHSPGIAKPMEHALSADAAAERPQLILPLERPEAAAIDDAPERGEETTCTMENALSQTGLQDLLWPMWTEPPPKIVRTDFSEPPVTGKRAMTPLQKELQQKLRNTSVCGPAALLGGTTMRSRLHQYGLEHLVIPPSSKKRVVWDGVSVLLLCYDMLMIPLAAFGVGVGGGLASLEISITAFWTIDIVVNFFSGFYYFSIVEMRLSKIARRYIASTFFLDAVIIIADWLLIISSYIDQSLVRLMRMNKIIRFGKVFRLIRMLRVLKLPSILQDMMDALHSESFNIAVGVVKAVVFIAVVNHFVACTWFAISDSIRSDSNSSEPTWVDVLYEEGRTDMVYFYLTALHWSLTQFMPASMEVTPRNTVERAYVICVVFVALIVFSSFVSTITAAMTHIRISNRTSHDQLEKIRRYVNERKVSLDLSSRISEFLHSHKVLLPHKVLERDIAAFKCLPTELKLLLHWQSHSPVLVEVPALAQMNTWDRLGLLQICHMAVSEAVLASGDLLFEASQEAKQCHFVLSGRLEFMEVAAPDVTKSLSSSGGNGRMSVLSEASLWIRYVHVGAVTAKTPSDILSLSVQAVHQIVSRRPRLHRACSSFAASFCEILRDVDQGSWDVWQASRDQRSAAQQVFGDAFFGRTVSQ